MSEISWIPRSMLRTSFIDKLKMNSDHSQVAFTVDIGNSERCTGAVKNIKTGAISDKIEGVSQIEFLGDNEVFYVEMNENNRPYKIKSRNLETNKDRIIFVDDDPTHYIDIQLTKDRSHLIINSGTKEDSEIWIMQKGEVMPQLLVKRQRDVRVHIDHLRDFFVVISNNSPGSKNFQLQTLHDSQLQVAIDQREWEVILKPTDSLVISEFECFDSFLAMSSRSSRIT